MTTPPPSLSRLLKKRKSLATTTTLAPAIITTLDVPSSYAPSPSSPTASTSTDSSSTLSTSPTHPTRTPSAASATTTTELTPSVSELLRLSLNRDDQRASSSSNTISTKSKKLRKKQQQPHTRLPLMGEDEDVVGRNDGDQAEAEDGASLLSTETRSIGAQEVELERVENDRGSLLEDDSSIIIDLTPRSKPDGRLAEAAPSASILGKSISIASTVLLLPVKLALLPVRIGLYPITLSYSITRSLATSVLYRTNHTPGSASPSIQLTPQNATTSPSSSPVQSQSSRVSAVVEDVTPQESGMISEAVRTGLGIGLAGVCIGIVGIESAYRRVFVAEGRSE